DRAHMAFASWTSGNPKKRFASLARSLGRLWKLSEYRETQRLTLPLRPWLGPARTNSHRRSERCYVQPACPDDRGLGHRGTSFSVRVTTRGHFQVRQRRAAPGRTQKIR